MCGKFSCYRRLASWLSGTLAVVLVLGSGCDSTGTGGGGLWNKPGEKGGERWTIHCLRSTAPNHAEVCNQLAEMLRRVEGLDARAVRVQSDATGSSIYYGEYSRVPGSSGSELVFPPKMQQDIERIRRLTLNQSMPFALAAPEQTGSAASGEQSEFHVSKAFNSKGERTLTLLIAVFYNTPTFNQRREAAEQYVQELRKEGVEAYFFHEPIKSYVFVGSFSKDALTLQKDGTWPDGREVRTWQVSKQVRDFAAARAGDEFQYLTENGYRQKRVGPDGQFIFVPSQLMPVPRPGATICGTADWP